MRTIRTMLLTGAAALSLAGFASFARAASPETHVLNTRLPDGEVIQVEYTGDVPPRIVVVPDAMPVAAPSEAPAAIQQDPSFAMLRQLVAAMDRQAAAMFRQMNAFADMPDSSMSNLTAAFSGPGVCMRSVQITYDGNGQAPHVVSQSSGDCGSSPDRVAPAGLPRPVPLHHQPGVVEAKAARPYQSLVHTVSILSR